MNPEMENKKGMSIIVPFLNEEDGIELFCREFDHFAGTLDFPIETVFVNDGSTDSTLELLQKQQFYNIQKVKVLNLSRNFGSHAAIRAGVLHSSYPICTWLGSDLQEPLELIPLSYHAIVDDGYDAVYVEKKTVAVSKGNRAFSKIYSKLMQKYAVKNYSDGGTSTIVFGENIKNFLNDNIEGNSSIMLQIMDAGYNYKNLSLDYKERAAGTSKWTLAKKIKLFIDSFVAFSYMPIRAISLVGAFLLFIGSFFSLFALVGGLLRLVRNRSRMAFMGFISLCFGITNISLGIVAEYLWRTYEAAKNKPVFIIRDEFELKG